MPGPAARKVYLDQTTSQGLSQDQLDTWVADTEGLSIAHLRELVAAVYCLDQPYDDVIKRLREMQVQVKAAEEFKRNNKMGFKSPTLYGVVTG